MPIYPTDWSDATTYATDWTDSTIVATNWEDDDPSAGTLLLQSSSTLLNETSGYMQLQ